MAAHLPRLLRHVVALTVVLGVGACVVPSSDSSDGAAQPGEQAVPRRPVPEVERRSGLVLSVTPEKTTYVVGEPVYVIVRLGNAGSEPENVPSLLELQSGALSVVVVGPDGRRRPFAPLFFADTSIPSRALAPGESIASVVPVFFGGEGWTFGRPGTYRIGARYAWSTRAFVGAGAVAIEVTPNEGASDLLVGDSEASVAAGKFLLWQQGDHLRSGTRLLNDLVETYPASPLADYARLAMASSLSRPFRAFSLGAVREADCSTALELFRLVRPERLPRYLRIKRYLEMERCFRSTGRSAEGDDARRAAEAVVALDPAYAVVFLQVR